MRGGERVRESGGVKVRQTPTTTVACAQSRLLLCRTEMVEWRCEGVEERRVAKGVKERKPTNYSRSKRRRKEKG